MLVYLNAELQLILGQNVFNSDCFVAAVCNGTGGLTKQWRQVGGNGIARNRGYPGKRVSRTETKLTETFVCISNNYIEA